MKKLDLKLGYSCNNNCLFCAVGSKRERPDKSTVELKADLEKAFGNGAKGVVFTGGEPTIRPDLAELIKYAKEIGFEDLFIQSNGCNFKDLELCKKLIVAGTTEFGPSLHGPNAKIHDSLTGREGSFEETVQGIKNLNELSQKVVTNSVVTKQNFYLLPELVEMLVSLNVDHAQLAFVHPMGNAWKNFETVVPSFSEAMPFIYRAIEVSKQFGLPLMVEAVPFCLMQGFERFSSEQYIPETEIREPGSVVEKFSIVRKEKAKKKGENCSLCKYFLVCEGPWKEYPEKKGFLEFVPVEGKKIENLKDLYC